MPDEGKLDINVVPRQSLSQESIAPDKIVIRKPINSAVYLEKEKEYMRPTRITSSLSVAYSDEGYLSTDRSTESTSRIKSENNILVGKKISSKSRFTKICTCISNPNKVCECHGKNQEKDSLSDSWETESSSSTETQITVTPSDNTEEVPYSEKASSCKLSTHRSLSSKCSLIDDPEEKEIRLREWLKRKQRQERMKKLEEERIRKEKEKQKAQQLEEQKQNYKRWLEKKRQQEEKLKTRKQREEEEKKRKEEEEKLEKNSKTDMVFQEWLINKKKAELQKKLSTKKKELRQYEENKRRSEINQRAFDEWLRNSKYRPKPVTPNKGLESLNSSNSVTYINPEPWVANIDLNDDFRY